MENKKLSMVDIAKIAGVSTATVSRIINKNGRYSSETEDKVLNTIKKYGYQINLSAKALRTSRSQSIGVIVPDITNEFFAKIVRAIETYLSYFDYTLFVCDTNENEFSEIKQINNLVSKDVDGIIVISGKTDVESISNQYNVPVVYIDRKPEHAGHLVISDNKKGGYLATKCLLDNGCRKILLLRDFRSISPILHRVQGYRKALDEFKVEFSDELIVDLKVDYKEAREKVDSLIKQGIKFDGIFACNDIVAIGALHSIINNGLKVPEDVKIIGFDDTTLSQICNPPLSTIHQNTDLFGKYSVDELFKMIDGDDDSPSISMVDVELIQRDTTK